MSKLSNIFIYSACFVACLSTARTHGYSWFNTENGTNALCYIDPTCRKLTDPELSVAQSYFGDTIDYDEVNLYSTYPLSPLFFLQGRHHHTLAASAAGQIYIPDMFWELEPYERVSVYLHEQTHVWQYQNNIPYNEAEPGYDYSFPLTENIAHYGIEQQAQIIQDLYLNRLALENTFSPYAQQLLCAQITEAEDLYNHYIPVGRTPSCYARPKI
jgi:hypothetical protein